MKTIQIYKAKMDELLKVMDDFIYNLGVKVL